MDFPLDYEPNNGSQLDRALRQYFKQNGAVPDASRLLPDNTGDGGIFPTLSVSDRQYVGRTVASQDANPDSPYTGNLEWIVSIMDQFPAIPEQDSPNPESHRVAIDVQVGKMMELMKQSSDGGQTYDQTAWNITDAGRSLAPTSFELVNCGTPAINGFYDKTDNQTWTHRSNDYQVLWNATDNRWELQDGLAVVLYTVALGSLPNGTWSKGTATAAVPQGKFDATWNDADMANFTCLFVVPGSQSRGHPTDDLGEIVSGLWRETRRFKIIAAPSVIPGYSNTAGA